jgi:hypothetical protein
MSGLYTMPLHGLLKEAAVFWAVVALHYGYGESPGCLRI